MVADANAKRLCLKKVILFPAGYTSTEYSKYLAFYVLQIPYKSSREAINPYTKLNEIVENGTQVQVVLQDEIEILPDGAPDFPNWCTKAFKHSEEGKFQSLEYARRREQADKTERQNHTNQKDTSQCNALKFSLENNPETMASTLEHDWHEINLQDVFHGQKKLLMDIKSTFLTYFIDIVVVLDHFSTCPGLSSITYPECLHYIHHTGILNLKQGNSYDLAMFNQCVADSTRHDPSQFPLPPITRPQLLELFVRLLSKKYKLNAIPMELKKILKDKVSVAAEALRVPLSPVRAALKQSQELISLVTQSGEVLKHVFDRYSMTAQDQHMPSSLTLPELHLILRDTDLVPGFDEVAKYHCTRDLFGVCQWLTDTNAGHKIEPLPNVVYNEFIEVVLLTMAEANSLYSVDFVQGFQEAMMHFEKLRGEESKGPR